MPGNHGVTKRDIKSLADFRSGFWDEAEAVRLYEKWLTKARAEASQASGGRCHTCGWRETVNSKLHGVRIAGNFGKCVLPGGPCCEIQVTPQKGKS